MTATLDSNFTVGQDRSDAQSLNAGSEPTSTGGHKIADSQVITVPGGFLRDPVLGVLADVVDDLEGVRIANANRVRILTRNEADDDGEERGHGLTKDHPEVKKLIATVDMLKQAEHDAILNLQRALRKHPLAPFQKRHKGLGEKQLARLLATIGDPYWHDLHDRPRTVSELWAYCGYDVRGGAAPKRTRGQKSNWSEDARKRTRLCVGSLIKVTSERAQADPDGWGYRLIYEAARVKYADSTHSKDCVRCGPAGKPALVGSPLSDGHKHARAIRITAKALLRDLWIESRDIYELRTA